MKYSHIIQTLFGICLCASCSTKIAMRSKARNMTSSTSNVADDWRAPDGQVRLARSLNGRWLFTPEGYSPRIVDVPCWWEAQPTPGFDRSCPGYLDGTPDGGLNLTDLNNWELRKVHRGKYEVDFSIDKLTPVTLIRFEAIHHKATVSVNGTKLGEHIGPYLSATFDATTAVHAGQNHLVVDVEDGHSLFSDQYAGKNMVANFDLGLPDFVGDAIAKLDIRIPNGNPSNDFRISWNVTIPDWPVGSYSHNDMTGIPRSVNLFQVPAIHVEKTFVVPSIQRRDLTAQFSIKNQSDRDARVLVRSRVVDRPGGESLFELHSQTIAVRAANRSEIVLVGDWSHASPQLWNPETPALYYLETVILDESGNPVDQSSERFGFREIWIENGDYMFNGKRLRLMGDSIIDHLERARFFGERYFSCAHVKKTFEKMKSQNIRYIRFHQGSPEDCVFEAADELGVMILAESGLWARWDIYPPYSVGDKLTNNSHTWLTRWIADHRNHPSIVMWSLENEMYLYGGAMTPNRLFDLQVPAKAADSIVRPDGIITSPRPVSWDGDSSLMYKSNTSLPPSLMTIVNNLPAILDVLRNAIKGDRPAWPMETINWHYPDGDWRTVDCEKEWFDRAVDHLKNFLVPEVPTGIGEIMFDRRNGLPDGKTYHQVKALQSQTVRAARILGYDEVRPFTLQWLWHDGVAEGTDYPNRPDYHRINSQAEWDTLAIYAMASLHPIAAFDKDGANTPPNTDGSIGPFAIQVGQDVLRVLSCMNDTFGESEQVHLEWKFVAGDSGVLISNGASDLNIKHGFSTEARVYIKAPQAGTYKLHVKTAMFENPLVTNFETDYIFIAL